MSYEVLFDGVLVVRGRNEADAQAYILENAGPDEIDRWTAIAESPIKLWRGAHVRHRQRVVSELNSIREAIAYVQREAAAPFAVMAGTRLLARASTKEEAFAITRGLPTNLRETRVVLFEPASFAKEHVRDDAPVHHVQDPWTVHPGDVVRCFDRLEDAQAASELLSRHAPHVDFTITVPKGYGFGADAPDAHEHG